MLVVDVRRAVEAAPRKSAGAPPQVRDAPPIASCRSGASGAWCGSGRLFWRQGAGAVGGAFGHPLLQVAGGARPDYLPPPDPRPGAAPRQEET